MSVEKIKTRAAFFSICSNVFLIILKLTVGFMTNSISIISEGVHSFTDLLAAIVAYFSVKQSSQPPDGDHQFGHGKYEDLSGFIEGALIVIAAGYIVYESVQKIVLGKIDLIDTTAGIVVMFLSVVVNIAVSRNLFRVAKQTDSMALLADAEHLRTDVITSAGVLVGLILIKITGISILDPIIAILVAFFILRVGLDLCFKSIKNLLDNSLPENDVNSIMDTINKYIPQEVLEVRRFKSRKSGPEKFIELILVIPKKSTVEMSHKLCDRLEDDLKNTINNSYITIHIEPCDSDCLNCLHKQCEFYEEELAT